MRKLTITRVLEATTAFIKVLRFGKDDVQTADQVLPFGVDSKPVNKTLAVFSNTSNKEQNIVLGYIYSSDNTNSGETRFYSTNTDGRSEKFYIKLTNDGICEFNGTDDNFVRYSKLQTAFDTLKADFNALVLKYNSHIHITTATILATAVPGVISPTTSQGSNSSADITGAKIDEIRTFK